VQTADESRCEQERAVVVNSGVTEIRGYRISAMLSANAFEVSRDFVESFCPRDALPALRRAANRIAQAIVVVMDVLQGDRLRADIATTERIVLVAADIELAIAAHIDLDAANRFTDIAVAIMAHEGMKLSTFLGRALTPVGRGSGAGLPERVG